MLTGLGNKFGLVGALVGRFPRWSMAITAAVSLLLISASLLLSTPRLELSLDAGFVPTGAPSQEEIRAQKAFFNATGESWYMALFGVAKGRGGGGGEGMLDEREFGEFNDFYTRVTKKRRSVVLENGTTVEFVYTDICEPLCDINDQMQKLMDHRWAGIGWWGNKGIFEMTIFKNPLTPNF